MAPGDEHHSMMHDSLPEVEIARVPCVTGEQMREVDRLMIEEFGIELLQMMENAGLALAQLARRHAAASLKATRVVVLAGRGNNGGGGLVAARRLSAWGADVSVVLVARVRDYGGAPARQLRPLSQMNVPIVVFRRSLPPHDLILDALIGYGLRGAVRGVERDLITAANASEAPVISLDVPSGLDADNGDAAGDAVRADATMTLALPKCGLLTASARAYVGDLYLADISVPPALYRRLGLELATPFGDDTVVRLVPG